MRRLRPFHANVGKRLVKTPKTYIRDSGLLHALLDIADFNKLAGHPVFGASWEGFVIENLLAAAPARAQASFFRTSAGAEIDLVLELPGGDRWGVEIKAARAKKPGRGFHNAVQDIQPDRAFVVYPATERFPLTEAVEAIGLTELAGLLASA